MIRVEVVNKTRKKIGNPFVRKIVKKVLKISRKRTRNISLSVIFVNQKEIKSLNRVYRQKNSSTDILSFDYSSGYNKVDGELFLCPEVVKKSAKENKISFEQELAFVLSHGVLHLLGFRHGKKMFELQDKVCGYF